MGIFDGLKQTAPTTGGNYVQPGKYVWEIQRCHVTESWNKKMFFIVELKVLTSIRTAEKHEPNGVDSKPSWMVEFPGQYKDLALGNIKAFLVAALGSLAVREGAEPPSPEEIGEREAELVTGEENILAGVKVEGEAFHKMTKKNTPFTRVNWAVSEIP